MIAKKCDRCGELYELYNVVRSKTNINGLMTLNIDEGNKYFSVGPYDLCPNCSKELSEWLMDKKGKSHL